MKKRQHNAGRIYEGNLIATADDVFAEVDDLARHFWPDVAEEGGYNYHNFRPVWLQADRHIRVYAERSHADADSTPIGRVDVADVMLAGASVGRSVEVYFSYYPDLAHAVVARLLARFDAAQRSIVPDALSPRQNQVAHLVADGLNDEEIAEALGIVPDTVTSHSKAIRREWGTASLSDLPAEAKRRGYGGQKLP